MISFKSGKARTGIKGIPLTTMEQIGDTYLFLPSTTQGWLIFLVFGTTEDYWKKFKKLLAGIFCFGYVHRRIRKRRQCAAATPEQSTDNIIADSKSEERDQVQSPAAAEEGETEIRKPARLNSLHASLKQLLPVP